MRKALSQEEKVFFEDHYKLLGPTNFVQQFNTLFCQNRSPKWAACVAKRMGVAQSTPEGYYTIQDVSFLLGVPTATIKEALILGRFAGTKGSHGKWFIPEDQFERMSQYWRYKLNPIPWPAIDTDTVAKALGVTRSSVAVAAKKGYIDSVKVGNSYMIRKSHFEAIVRIMKKTGWLRAPWSKLRKFIEEGKI